MWSCLNWKYNNFLECFICGSHEPIWDRMCYDVHFFSCGRGVAVNRRTSLPILQKLEGSIFCYDLFAIFLHGDAIAMNREHREHLGHHGSRHASPWIATVIGGNHACSRRWRTLKRLGKTGGILCLLSLLHLLSLLSHSISIPMGDCNQLLSSHLPSTAYSFLSNLMILGIWNLYGHGKNPIVWWPYRSRS